MGQLRRGASYYGGYGRLIAEGDAQTDDQGRVTFRCRPTSPRRRQSQLFTIEASVTDVNGQQVSNRTAAIVHKGEFYVGVAPRGYLAEVGEEKQIDLLTVDWDGEPVAGVAADRGLHGAPLVQRAPAGRGWRLLLGLGGRGHPGADHDGDHRREGQAVATFAPDEGGQLPGAGHRPGQRGNEIRSSAYFWVWGGSEYVSWRQESNNRIELIADKEEYQVGDVAEILIPSPYSGTVQALVTIERGHIMETEVRELETNSEVLRVPITEDHVPNVFVSVVIVQGSEQAPDGLATFKMGVVKLPVSLESKELTITLTPDKDMDAGEHYGPRQTATYDVLVTDHEGQPVEAELSLRLADLAVLALADEPGPTLMERFWRDRGLGVKTSTSLVVAMEPFNRELAARGQGGRRRRGGRPDPQPICRHRLLGSGGAHRRGRQGPGDGAAARQPDHLADAGPGHHRRHPGGPRRGGRGQHPGPAGAPGAAPLLCRRATRPRSPPSCTTTPTRRWTSQVNISVEGWPWRARRSQTVQRPGRGQGQSRLAGRGPAGRAGQGADVGHGRRSVRRPRGHPAGLSLLHARGGGHRRPAGGARCCGRRSSNCRAPLTPPRAS